MKYFRTLNSKSLPAPLGWIAAFTSVFLFLWASVMFQLFIEGLTQLLHFKEFEQRVYLGQSVAVLDKDLDTIVKQDLSPVAEFVTAQIMNEYDEEHFNRVHIVRLMREVLKDIGSHDYNRALSLYKTTVDEDKTYILSNLGADKESLVIIEDAEKDMDRGRELVEKIEQKKRERRELDRELQAILPRYKVLAAEFADAFSLNAENPKNPRAPLPLYEYGALQGMPKIEKIRDNLPDLVALKSEVELLKGEVKFRGETAYQQFSELLDRVRTSCTDLAAEQHGLLQAAKESGEDARRLGDELTQTQMKAAKRVLQIILAHSKPDLGSVSGDIYRFVRAISTKLEFLPDLPQI